MRKYNSRPCDKQIFSAYNSRYCDLAEAFLADEDKREAISYYQSAQDVNKVLTGRNDTFQQKITEISGVR